MTAKALRRKKVRNPTACHLLTLCTCFQNRKVKQEAKKEKASIEEALLRKEALQQIKGGPEDANQNYQNGEDDQSAQRGDG